jgi:hypothetical protein
MVSRKPSANQVFSILIAFGLLSACAAPYNDSYNSSSSTGTGTTTAVQITSSMYLSYSSSSVAEGGTVQFSASGGASPYTYEVVSPSSAGTISSSGLFTAGSTAETVEIGAEDSDGNWAYATVVIGTSSTSLSLNATNVSVPANGTYQFTASGGTAPYEYFVELPSSPVGGSIAASGLYTAPSDVGMSIQIVVQDSDGNTASATVTTTTPNYTNLCDTNTACGSVLGYNYELDGGMISSAATNAYEACIKMGYTGVYDYNVEQHSTACGEDYGLVYWNGSAFAWDNAPICGDNFVDVISNIDCTTQ